MEALSDFHLLLWLAAQPHFDMASDMTPIAGAVADHQPIGEGYKMIVESLAGV